MISRRKIISRSLDNLDTIGGIQNEDEEDVWHDKEKLFRDHIKEVLSKWEQIDDEIWAKIIVFEKNRRVAKAYARSSVISINGSKNGFDGVRIGLNGFENPMRDSATKVVKKVIGDGFKIKMDEVGNILIKRYGKSNVYVHNTAMSNEESVIGSEIMQAPHMTTPHGTSAKLFDMRKYTTNIGREFSQTYPESCRLERQCLSAVSLVKSSNNLITSPLWILIINVVAMDMLKNQLQSISKPMGGSSEDPYSTIDSQVGIIYPSPSASSDDSTNSNNSNLSYSIKSRKNLYNAGFLDENPYVPKPDYEIYNQGIPILPTKKSVAVQRKKQDDPYYCGLLARIPNFIRSSKNGKQSKKEAKMFRKISASQQVLYPQPTQPLPLAAFHSQYPPQTYYPFKVFGQQQQQHQQQHRLSHSQISLWDARSLISAHE